MIRSLLRPARAAGIALVVAAAPTLAMAQPGEIKGQDVMGDKSRSANDGWSQAPVPREESAAKDAPNPGGRSTEQNANRPVPDAGSSDNSATDPQKPLDHRTPGPSGHNPASPSR
ncbi:MULTISPECIES: hypothetical protein [Methylobacterium]|uniref:Secreted protein n=1 Tax=Methylobacterium jeotgali TaxID=381630 RepID=A0ABQ4SZR5_9HYPH|nr:MULTISPECIES: hypothetical protein [Methylobacterium]PIU07972.1 MAG: hypothetical protein COT56_02910 [Methylobacterium sp. CG09_land_8_20_14_0_10_71_15]PIU15766.1 MAG: hypothetical protein COT28_02955 [Methylobacterium sp. CG08_land_8_20_14_0_20_71_15]GJE08577.1 hypothetical protein AOPFMNJM_3918 [Methylobacterium jeotgali]